jgi:heme/copper-type cytochrome/quinol oxidase subunit 2
MKYTNVLAAISILSVFLIAGCTTTANSTANSAPVKEFSMESFYTMDNGTPHPQFSLNEITVNKGDRVRITITDTKGTHNFNLDEFNIHADTPLNQPVTVEFTADKTGDFIYYCSVPGHRAAGHWGTLHVR